MFQTTAYKKVVRIAKPVLAVVLTVFIFYKLFFTYRVDELIRDVRNQGTLGQPYLLWTALLLMLFNWGIESWKWKFLISRFEPVSFFKSVRAVLSGVTLSVITPNQIGDFAGRVIHLEFMDKWRGSLVTVIGHTAQVLVTLIFGIFSLAYLEPIHKLGQVWLPWAIVLVVLILFFYVRMGDLYHRLVQWKSMKKFGYYLNVFSNFRPGELFLILFASFLRYLVFLFQYYLLLNYFGVDIPLKEAAACIIATFCVQSVVPSFLLLEIGLRGASALYFFTLFSDNQMGILLAAYSLWMVNMLIPAIAGMYFIYRVRS